MNPDSSVLAEDEITRITRIEIDEEDAPEPEEPNEDVLGVLMRSTDGAGPGPKQLEISQVWGDALLATRRFPLGTSVAVGGGGCAFFAPVLPGGMARHTLIEGESIRVPSSWDGFADLGSRRLTFDEMVAEGLGRKDGDIFVIPVLGDTRVLVDADGMVFLARRVATPQKAPLSPLGLFLSMDFLFTAVAGATLFVGAGLLAVTWLRPPGIGTGVNDDSMQDFRVTLDLPPPPVPPSAGSPKDPGTRGAPKADKKQAKGAARPMSKAQLDRARVENAGLLGAMNSDAMAHLGEAGLSADIQGGIGGLIGVKGSQIGSFGLANRGGGLGGDGRTEGLGGIGLHGDCRGPHCGDGRDGVGVLTRKTEGHIDIPQDILVLGSLDRALIDEVIKRNMSKIRYCYQRELTKDTGLAGKISMKFTIAKDGAVAAATTKSTSMKNGAVEGCIERTFMKMSFPQPRGGGIVIVSYPFLFSPG